MIIRIQAADFDIAAVSRELLAGRSDVGAIASFIGLVRDLQGDPLQQMTLEHYPGMTEKQLANIVEEAGNNWALMDVLVVQEVHRNQNLLRQTFQIKRRLLLWQLKKPEIFCLLEIHFSKNLTFYSSHICFNSSNLTPHTKAKSEKLEL